MERFDRLNVCKVYTKYIEKDEEKLLLTYQTAFKSRNRIDLV